MNPVLSPFTIKCLLPTVNKPMGKGHTERWLCDGKAKLKAEMLTDDIKHFNMQSLNQVASLSPRPETLTEIDGNAA